MYFEKSKGFPADFLWGSASAAYQVEGAWNVLLENYIETRLK